MKILTAGDMQILDHLAMTDGGIPGATLMANAGARVLQAMEKGFGPVAGKHVVIFCGKGNNGGDGFVVARLLRAKRARVSVFLIANITDLKGDAKTMCRRFRSSVPASWLHQCPSEETMRQTAHGSDLMIDALLGTGLTAPVTGAYRAAIDIINNAASGERNVPVTAIDLPSGIHADTGAVMGCAVRATLTVTLGLPKLGLYVGAGIDHAGRIRIADIGIPERYAEKIHSRLHLITQAFVRRVLPPRAPSAHKGTFGHAGIIAGSVGKTGAAALAAKTALRTGAGLVTVATPSSVNMALECKLLEAMTVPMPDTEAQTLSAAGLERLAEFANTRSSVAIGPGLTTHPDTVALVRALLPRLNTPSVLDADALNALAGRMDLIEGCPLPPILTPHPGEMARLENDGDVERINADRIGVATQFAQRHRVVLVLKGARTVVAAPDGHTAICPTGNAGMATAGTGDALTGMITGLLAQRLAAWDAACAGAYLHGLAGDLAAATLGPAGMTAGDLIDQIPYAITQAGAGRPDP